MQYIDKKHLPKTLYREKDRNTNGLEQAVSETNISFPCVVKADISRRSQKVAIIHTISQLQEHINNNNRGNILIQEYLQDQLEFGVSYRRIPGEQKGNIIGLMYRNFAHITGDGIHMVKELIEQHPRYRRYTDILQQQNKDIRDTILGIGIQKHIVPFGAHSRGTIFEDRGDRISPQLEQQIDAISTKIPGFYVGRYDIKTPSREAFQQGDFSILELNGVGGIPAHMYDPKYSIWQGWNILFNYWFEVIQVSDALYKTYIHLCPGVSDMYSIITGKKVLAPLSTLGKHFQSSL